LDLGASIDYPTFATSSCSMETQGRCFVGQSGDRPQLVDQVDAAGRSASPRRPDQPARSRPADHEQRLDRHEGFGLLARPEGAGRALATYEIPIEGRDEWIAAAERLA